MRKLWLVFWVALLLWPFSGLAAPSPSGEAAPPSSASASPGDEEQGADAGAPDICLFAGKAYTRGAWLCPAAGPAYQCQMDAATKRAMWMPFMFRPGEQWNCTQGSGF